MNRRAGSDLVELRGRKVMSAPAFLGEGRTEKKESAYLARKR